MKQKLLNSTLYVFDVNPYTITEDASEATVIKVQEESYKGFVELNPSLAEKIVKYNYHTMCVNVPEWAPYVDDQLTFSIYGAAAGDPFDRIELLDADNNIIDHWEDGYSLSFPFQCDVKEGQHIALECKEGISDVASQFGVTGMEYIPVRWVNEETGRTWYGTLAITDSISIGIENVEPSAWTVTLTGTGLSAETVTIKNGGETVALAESYTVEKDAWFEIFPLQDPSYYTLVSENMQYDTEQGNEHWYVMPSRQSTDTTAIELNYAAPASTHEVVINSDIAMTEIMEQTPDHQTIVNTYASPSSPFTMTVNGGNIVTVEFDNGEPFYIYDISPNGFFAGQWQTDTGKYISFSEPISDDVNVTIQPRTYTVTLDGSDIHQHVTVKMNGETVQSNIEYQNVTDGTVVDVYPTGNVADYALQSGAVWDTDHWTATVNGADLTITINYLGAGVNFVASWDNGSVPENLGQINIGSAPVTGNALGDSSWTDTFRLYPGSSNITFFVSTGLPSDMDTFVLILDGIEHKAHWNIDPQTGDKTVNDDNGDSANPGTWTYNDNPDTGLPYIAFELPALSGDDTPWQDNDTMEIYVQVQGS